MTRVRGAANAANNEEGSALIEFVGLSVLLLLPLVFLLLSVFSVQRAAFAVTQAAREAGRAFATAPSTSVARSRAAYAAQLALTSQGMHAGLSVRYAPAGFGCSVSSADGAASLLPGARFVVCVRSRAALPLGGGVTVNGQYAVSVDSYRTARP
jgi:Flp pilus assembly protein TadG